MLFRGSEFYSVYKNFAIFDTYQQEDSFKSKHKQISTVVHF